MNGDDCADVETTSWC